VCGLTHDGWYHSKAPHSPYGPPADHTNGSGLPFGFIVFLFFLSFASLASILLRVGFLPWQKAFLPGQWKKLAKTMVQ